MNVRVISDKRISSDRTQIAVRELLIDDVEAVEIREFQKEAGVWGHGIVFTHNELPEILDALNSVDNAHHDRETA